MTFSTINGKIVVSEPTQLHRFIMDTQLLPPETEVILVGFTAEAKNGQREPLMFRLNELREEYVKRLMFYQ